MLFSWARCEAFVAKHHARMLAPQWTKLKIGPLLRRESDLRYYTGLFSSAGYVRGISKALTLLRARHFTEQQIPEALSAAKERKPVVVDFAGMERDYEPFYDSQPLIRRRLHEILADNICQRLQEQLKSLGPAFIAAHVRRGDKNTMKFGEPFPVGLVHTALPLEWFINVCRGVRREVGPDVPIAVFSDGKADQLGDLLKLENVRLVEGNPSIVDILLIAASRAVITTGSSSFSTWGAFLNRLPSVWYPQSEWAPTIREWLADGDMRTQPETDLQGNFPEEFGEVLRSACTARDVSPHAVQSSAGAG